MIICVCRICALIGIGDICSRWKGVKFIVHLNSCESVLISHWWKLADSHCWVTEWSSPGRAPTGKVWIQGTQNEWNTVLECLLLLPDVAAPFHLGKSQSEVRAIVRSSLTWIKSTPAPCVLLPLLNLPPMSGADMHLLLFWLCLPAWRVTERGVEAAEEEDKPFHYVKHRE